MKFVHIADLHMDSPFTYLNNKLGIRDIRRIEQRQALRKAVEYIQDNNIEYLFISGDLFEQQYVRESTIKFINEQFNQIYKTKIFISPGNHDPYLKNSFYNNYKWSSNVYIFKGDFEFYEDENVDIYGMAFNDYYMKNCNFDKLEIKNKNKLNILVMHCDLNASKETTELSYNPVSISEINEKGFDYVALGHIHNTNYKNNNKIVYPGSTVSLGFDELGMHGMIVGDVDKQNIKLNFIQLDNRIFEEKEIDVTDILEQDELIEKINNLNYQENTMYKIILTGKRNFLIEVQAIEKSIDNNNILKIVDNTKIKYNLEELSHEISLRGLFIKECLKKFDDEEYSKEEIYKAIEIGLESM